MFVNGALWCFLTSVGTLEIPFAWDATWSERSGWKALDGDGVLIEAALEGGRVSAPWSGASVIWNDSRVPEVELFLL
jgi:hypothetical protein